MNFSKKISKAALGLIFFSYSATNSLLAGAQSPSMVQNEYSPSPVAVQWANRGIDLSTQGDYTAAIEALFEAWKLDPGKTPDFAHNLSITYNNYAKTLAERNKLDEALSQFRKAVFYEEDNKIPSGNLNTVLKKKGLNPNDAAVRLSQARNLRGNGSLEESVAEYWAALNLLKPGTPDYLKAKLELAQVYQVIYFKYAPTQAGQNIFSKMKSLIQDLMRTNPRDARPHILLGSAHLTGERLPESIDAFEKALSLEPRNQKAIDGLVGAWREVVRIAPNEPDNLIGLAGALLRQGSTDEATALLQKAKTLAPKNQEIEKMLGSSKEIGEEAQAFKVAERALEAQKAGKMAEAIELYRVAIKKLPPTPATSDIYYNLGVAYQSQGQTSEAMQAYNQALKFNPSNIEAKKALEGINQQAIKDKIKLSEKAVSLQGEGKLDEAIQIYQKLLKDDPKDAQTHFNLGTAYQAQNKLKEALGQYQTASKLAPSNTEFSAAVNTLREAMDSGAIQAREAAKLLQEAVSLQQSGKANQAIQKYQEALRLDPKNAQAHFNLGTALHSSNQAEDAILEYRQSYKLDPAGYPEANYFIGNLMESKNKYPEAIAYYKRYLEDQPKSEYSQEAEERIKVLESKNGR